MENLKIAIIGNIGAGKTTLIKNLQAHKPSEILLSCLGNKTGHENIYTFEEEFDNVVLDTFYSDPVKHAFMAQIEFLNGRLTRLPKLEEARGIVLEDRTIYEDYHVFGKAQKILGNMTDAQFRTYQRCFNLMTAKTTPPDLVVYLRSSTDVLLKHIKQRGRPSEQAIPRDYLDLLNNLYEEFVSKHLRCPVLIFDSEINHHVSQDVEKIAQQIVDKILEQNLRVTTPGIREWVTLPETEAALRVIDAERKLEDYLKKHPKLITVAGNVGIGKSTVTALMHRSLRIHALHEAPEKNPLLEKFLKDKKTYCYELQKHFINMRAEQIKKGKQGDYSYVKDRSLAEDILIFCQLFHQDGYLTSNELDLLFTEFQKVNRELPKSDLMIILEGSANLAWHRIMQRARAMEMNGGWSYREIAALNDLYKTFPEDVVRCGYHDGSIIQVDANNLDFTNRIHMGYLFEKTYTALQKA